MLPRVVFEKARVRCFRNLSSIQLELSPKLNVISGDNGQGKTSLLEALYFVATSRSFRTERVTELIAQGESLAHVKAWIREGQLVREQQAALGPRKRSFAVDGNKPARLSSYAVSTPVVAFHPGDLGLVSGPSAGRRRLLDRLALYLEPSSGADRTRYRRALSERQRALQRGGPRAAELGVYEQLMARHGSRLAAARERAAERMVEALQPAFAELSVASLELEAIYVPGGSKDANECRERLEQDRAADARRRRASFGPHRDELEFTLQGRSARKHASQGQQRLLTLALKAAELQTVSSARGAQPVLLLDDVSSELDPQRTGAVYAFLMRTASQVFVTTTRPELFVTPDAAHEDRADFTLRDGSLA